jgi:hypothetical protein
LPSFTGTLRSARMRTRLPLRSRSVSLMTDMMDRLRQEWWKWIGRGGPRRMHLV